MFCTLKQSKDADNPYASHQSDPPFSKSKNKFNVIACMSCRASKTKCTGERDGCNRCLSRNWPCKYPPDSKGSGSTRGRNSASTNASQATNDDIINGLQDIEQVDMGIFDVCTDIDPTLSSSGQTSPGTMSLNDTTTLTDLSIQTPSYTLTEHSDFGQWDSTFDVTDIDTSLFSIQPKNTTTGNAIGSESGCRCHTRAIIIHESVEVDLVWAGKQQPVDAMEMLQHQKRIISGCESLLDCQQCTRRSDFNLMLISLYDKLISSLENTSQERQLRQSDDFLLSSKHQDWRRPISARHDLQDFSDKPLDKEDYFAALGSLFLLRVTKLSSLLSRTERLVLERHWMPHKAMVQSLRHRLRLVEDYVAFWYKEREQ